MTDPVYDPATLVALREAAGFTSTEVATITGIPEIAEIEAGAYPYVASIDTLRRLCLLYRVSLACAFLPADDVRERFTGRRWTSVDEVVEQPNPVRDGRILDGRAGHRHGPDGCRHRPQLVPVRDRRAGDRHGRRGVAGLAGRDPRGDEVIGLFLIVAPSARDGVPTPADRAGEWFALGAGDAIRAERMAAPYLESGDYDLDRAIVALTEWQPPWDGDSAPATVLWPSAVIIEKHQGEVVAVPVPYAAPILVELGEAAL